MQSVNHSAPAKIMREREGEVVMWILQHSYKSVGWGRVTLGRIVHASTCACVHVIGGEGGVGVQLASYIAHVQHNGNMCTVV